VSLLSLEKQVLAFLLTHSEPVKPQDIVKAIGESKQVVNQTLYNLQKRGLIKKIVVSPPVWQILEKGQAAL